MLMIILYVVHGILGALLNVLIWSQKPEDLKEFESLKTYIIGGIAGYIYYLLVNNYNFPDSFMSVVFGYFAKDIIDSLFERFRNVIMK